MCIRDSYSYNKANHRRQDNNSSDIKSHSARVKIDRHSETEQRKITYIFKKAAYVSGYEMCIRDRCVAQRDCHPKLQNSQSQRQNASVFPYLNQKDRVFQLQPQAENPEHCHSVCLLYTSIINYTAIIQRQTNSYKIRMSEYQNYNMH